MRWYKLGGPEGKTPILTSMEDACRTWDLDNRIVKKTKKKEVEVSTVFLSLDHQFFGGVGPPLVFETMIFGGEHDLYQTRCSTWAEAENMHKVACRLVFPVGVIHEGNLARIVRYGNDE